MLGVEMSVRFGEFNPHRIRLLAHLTRLLDGQSVTSGILSRSSRSLYKN